MNTGCELLRGISSDVLSMIVNFQLLQVVGSFGYMLLPPLLDGLRQSTRNLQHHPGGMGPVEQDYIDGDLSGILDRRFQQTNNLGYGPSDGAHPHRLQSHPSARIPEDRPTPQMAPSPPNPQSGGAGSLQSRGTYGLQNFQPNGTGSSHQGIALADKGVLVDIQEEEANCREDMVEQTSAPCWHEMVAKVTVNPITGG